MWLENNYSEYQYHGSKINLKIIYTNRRGQNIAQISDYCIPFKPNDSLSWQDARTTWKLA